MLLAGLVLMGLAAAVVQVGFHFSPGILALRWERLSPAEGWTRLMSGAFIMRGLVFFAKVVLASAMAWFVVKSKTTQLSLLPTSTLATSTAAGWSLAMRLALAVAAAFLLLGVADFLFQRWRHTNKMMMTRHEWKEEMKRDEGDPQMRAHPQATTRSSAQARMLQDVPRATVVITNPTHLAVALRYDRATMAAPRVVAKGAGHVAQRIVELARRHAVPVLERKPVARALFKAVKVGQEIPAALYHAVAEVLAYLFRLRARV